MTLLYDQTGNRKYLNPTERRLFYETVQNSDKLPDRSLCLALILTGCRISEALSLRRENIDEAEKTLVFKTLKQRGEERSRALPVPGSLIDVLLQQMGSEQGSKIWSFSRWTGWRIVKSYMEEAGLTGAKATPKGLRHAFAIDNLSKEVPLTTISKWLGHANIDTTKIYLDFIGPEERALARRAWPLEDGQIETRQGELEDLLESEFVAWDDFQNPGNLGDTAALILRRQKAGWVVSRIDFETRSLPGNVAVEPGIRITFTQSKCPP